MAHNSETIKLLKKLGLEYGPADSETREIYNNFLRINSHRPAAEINKELREMLIMVEQAKQKAAEFLASHGLTATEFVPSWNKYFMCLELKCKINGTPNATDVDQYLSYEGREIQIRIMHGSSNNNFNPDDVRKMFELKKQAALAINSNINTKVDELEEQAQIIMSNFGTQALSITIKNTIDIERELLCRLAVELIRHDYQAFDYNPSQDEIEGKILAIQYTEASMVSRKNRRAIKIVAYPQETSDTSKHSQWMLTTNIPKSDISSDERSLTVRRVPNAWELTQYACRIQDGSLQSISKHAAAYRSASVAQLHEGQIQRGAASDEYKNLCNLIIQTARDQLIERINNGEHIILSENLLIKTAYITLLTPLLDKDASSKSIVVRKAGSKLQETLITGNEHEQLNSLKVALQTIKDSKLSFTPLDTKYIISHIRPDLKVPPDLESKISKVVIKHQYFYSNFTVNSFKGVDLGKVKDCVKNNQAHNAEGLEFLEQHLQIFLAARGIDFTRSRKEWPEFKTILLQKLAGNLDNESHKILTLYMQLGDYFESQKSRNFKIAGVISNILTRPSANSMLVESYFAAAIEQQIATLLGFNIRTTCKSGKDRTGLFLAILEASAGPPEKFRLNLCRALKYSDVKELIEQNRPGCRGIQIDADVMDGLRQYSGVPLQGPPGEFKKLLELWESRAVGSIPKKVYKDINLEVAEYVKRHPPTPGGKPPVISAPASNPQLGKKIVLPIVPPRTYPPPPSKAIANAYLQATTTTTKEKIEHKNPDTMTFAEKRAMFNKDNDGTKKRG